MSDPVMGLISDNSHWRWGRRKPFVLMGAAFTALFCAAMWLMPSGLDVPMPAVYFSVAAVLYYAAYTVFYVPYNTRGYEMTDNYDELTRMMTFKWEIGATSSFLVIPAVLPLCYWINPNNATVGARWIGPTVELLILVLAVPAALLPRERKAAPASIPFFRARVLTQATPSKKMNKSRAISAALVLGTMVPAAHADIDHIERSGNDWTVTSRVPGDFTSVAPSVNMPSRIFTANASGGVEGRDLPGLAVAFRSAAGHYLDLAARRNGGAGNNDLYAVNSEGSVVWLCYSDGWQEVPLVVGDYTAVTEAVRGDFAVALRRDGGIDEIAWSDGWKARPAGVLEQPLVDITTQDGRYYAISTEGDLYEVSATSAGILDGTRKLLDGDFIAVAGNTSGSARLWLADAKGGLLLASGKDGSWSVLRAVEGPTIYRNLQADIHHKDGQLWAVGGGDTDLGESADGKPVGIGSRRELFLDNLMVARMTGGAERVFHKSVPREVVITFDNQSDTFACAANVVTRARASSMIWS